jgi:Carboxymuconolactone decarboxylase family
MQGLYLQMSPLAGYREKSTIESGLRHLVELRTSQINGRAFCMALHTREELADLTLLTIENNGWNRVSIAHYLSDTRTEIRNVRAAKSMEAG